MVILAMVRLSLLDTSITCERADLCDSCFRNRRFRRRRRLLIQRVQYACVRRVSIRHGERLVAFWSYSGIPIFPDHAFGAVHQVRAEPSCLAIAVPVFDGVHSNYSPESSNW